MKSRYEVLLDLVHKHKPQTIVEVGTWKGKNAIRMLQAARMYHDKPMYIGYDLFEDATEETDKLEFNVKAHHQMEDVRNKITKHCPWAEVALVKGNTNETLINVEADFAFIDGGHSIETIRNDYEALKNCKVIVFDDYYIPDEEGKCPDTSKVGCNEIVKDFKHDILRGDDRVIDGGIIALAVVNG